MDKWISLLFVLFLSYQLPLAAKETQKTQDVETARNANAGAQIPQAVNSPLKPVNLPPSLPQVTLEDSLRIQRQISEMIKVHEQLKLRYQSQAAEIQRIAEQAKIHQRILQDLEKQRRVTAKETLDAQEILRQEKIRMIIQETQKNQSYLNGLAAKDIPSTQQ